MEDGPDLVVNLLLAADRFAPLALAPVLLVLLDDADFARGLDEPGARTLDLGLAARDRAPLLLGRGAQRLLLRAQVCEVRAVRERACGHRAAAHRLQHLRARRGLPPAARL